MSWGRWDRSADMIGYMRNRESVLTRLARRQAHIPVQPLGVPQLVLPWKQGGDGECVGAACM